MNNYIVLNSTNFYPTAITSSLDKIGDLKRAANGTLYYYHRANKRNWELVWTSLPETDLSGIRTIAELTSSFTFTDENNTNYTVLVPSGGFEVTLAADKMRKDGFFYYDVTLRLDQV